MTSLIGTMASELLCRFVSMDETLDVKDWLVLGDDVLLMGYHIKEKVAASRIEQFGLIAKDPPIANCTGMFLQRTYEYGFTMMSFGRAVRQCFYANPWIERSQFTDPQSLAHSWLQATSRVPSRTVRPLMLRQTAGEMARYYELLTTDSGHGGLGTLDTHIVRDNITTIRTKVEDVKYPVSIDAIDFKVSHLKGAMLCLRMAIHTTV
ncbi:unnamed protein product [Nippostrongylus brasiliensis]|uniref:RNA-dependent RNA polymerase n=1 Tax=Nippostrongylus brasiliensis TaxID=27835 RepID=A0A0N4Y974_NIPBR|nr:unnamed protein product [Nippostrongylus brasiliensis]